jgi:hypothetical protein
MTPLVNVGLVFAQEIIEREYLRNQQSAVESNLVNICDVFMTMALAIKEHSDISK